MLALFPFAGVDVLPYLFIFNGVKDGDGDVGSVARCDERLDPIFSIGQSKSEDFLELQARSGQQVVLFGCSVSTHAKRLIVYGSNVWRKLIGAYVKR